jgi:hypothetical protein
MSDKATTTITIKYYVRYFHNGTQWRGREFMTETSAFGFARSESVKGGQRVEVWKRVCKSSCVRTFN